VPLFETGLALLAVVAGIPAGLGFGWMMHRLSQALSDRLRTAWTASNDPAQLAATSVPWLAGVAAARCVLSPVSWLGSSAIVAAAGAAWQGASTTALAGGAAGGAGGAGGGGAAPHAARSNAASGEQRDRATALEGRG
jgi:hypothetical protein